MCLGSKDEDFWPERPILERILAISRAIRLKKVLSKKVVFSNVSTPDRLEQVLRFFEITGQISF